MRGLPGRVPALCALAVLAAAGCSSPPPTDSTGAGGRGDGGRPVAVCALAPEVSLGAAEAVPDKAISVAGRSLSLTRGQGRHLGETAEGFIPLDDNLVAYSVPAGSPVDIGKWRMSSGGTYIADMAKGTARGLCSDGIATDASPDGARLLLTTIRDGRVVLSVIDRAGTVLGSLTAAGGAHGTFLANGAVTVADGMKVAVWSPGADPEWNPLPANLGEVLLVAADTNVVAVGDRGESALVDPATGRQIGKAWATGGMAGVAASPDGSAFAAVIGTDANDGTVEVRSSRTAALLATIPGQELSDVPSLAWLGDTTLLVLRHPAGPGGDVTPEVYEIDATSVSRPATGKTPVDDVLGVRARHGVLIFFGMKGSIVRETIEEGAK